nr:hypothetical protein Iba_chr10cCG12970 [Ipomoea batatas]GMD44233.1 hypothetical protein Iba_chr10cCG12980 [Ipomoea batatas]
MSATLCQPAGFSNQLIVKEYQKKKQKPYFRTRPYSKLIGMGIWANGEISVNENKSWLFYGDLKPRTMEETVILSEAGLAIVSTGDELVDRREGTATTRGDVSMLLVVSSGLPKSVVVAESSSSMVVAGGGGLRSISLSNADHPTGLLRNLLVV